MKGQNPHDNPKRCKEFVKEIQYHFIIKFHYKLGIDRIFHNKNTKQTNKLLPNIKLSGERLNSFPQRLGKRQIFLLSLCCLHLYLVLH